MANRKESDRKYREANKERVNIKVKEWKLNNPDYMKQWIIDNPEKIKEYRLKDREAQRIRSKEYIKNNPDKMKALWAKNRARRRQAVPSWFSELDEFVGIECADLVKRRTELTNIKWHLDHIIPLKNDKVCGLHVWNNFRVIPAQENMEKHNKFYEHIL